VNILSPVKKFWFEGDGYSPGMGKGSRETWFAQCKGQTPLALDAKELRDIKQKYSF
jgi:hypothetical protein